jgi:hypothetical protein
MSNSISPPVGGELTPGVHGALKQPTEFRDDEHSIGCVVKGMLAQSIWGLLLLGRELSVAFELLSKRGRGSLYPLFLSTYLPTIDRKTADRWRTAYACFKKLLPIDEDRTDCPEIERFRLTAIYRLCRSDASESHRKAALALANQGVVVSENMAASLVKGDAAKSAAPRLRKHTIELANGAVEIRVDDDDVATALRSALAAVTRDNPAVNS